MPVTDNSASAPRAYSYIRMSSAQQIRGDSLRRQLELSQAYALEHDLLLDDSLRDIGVSAWKGTNHREGALASFLELAERGDIPRGSYLLIESLDRLSREQILDALQLFLRVIQSGVTIVTLADRQVYSHAGIQQEWTRLIMSLAVMARAHEESQRKSERVRAANASQRARAQRGEAHYTHNIPGWIDREMIGKNRYKFSLNEHADTVRRIFEMTAEGLGQTRLTQILNLDAVKTPRGHDWHQATIRNILASRAVLGEYQPTERRNGRMVALGEPVANYYPACVEVELFNRAQAARKRVVHPGRKADMANLLTGIVWCQHCMGRMNVAKVKTPNGEIRRYYFCANGLRSTCKVPNANFRVDKLENALLDHVRQFHLADSSQQGNVDHRLQQLRRDNAVLVDEIGSLKSAEMRLMEQMVHLDPSSLPQLRMLINSKADARKAVEAQLAEGQHTQTLLENRLRDHHEVEAQIAGERASWQHVEGDVLFQSRTRVSAALKTFIDHLMFNSLRRTVIAVIAGGAAGYEFREGELLSSFNLADSAFINDRHGTMTEQDWARDLAPHDRAARVAQIHKLLSRA